MSGWDTWDEEKYHKNNKKKRERCVKRAKCCFICKVPKGATRTGADGEDYNIFLAAAHLDHDPWNPRARMEALCQDCHNKWDVEDRILNRRVTDGQKEEKSQVELGQMPISLKIKGDQDKLRTKNRRKILVDTEWKVRNLKRYSGESEASTEAQSVQQLPLEFPEEHQKKRTEVPSNRRVSYQQQYRKCNKPACKPCCNGGQGHGPYWYAYWREGDKVRSAYIGKELQNKTS